MYALWTLYDVILVWVRLKVHWWFKKNVMESEKWKWADEERLLKVLILAERVTEEVRLCFFCLEQVIVVLLC